MNATLTDDTDTDNVTDKDTDTETVTDKVIDTAGSQVLSKTFDILAGNQLYDI